MELTANQRQATRIMVAPVSVYTAVWAQFDYTLWANCIWSNRFTAGAGWETATLIETDMESALKS